MITRPLDLASRLRSQPRNFDGLFFVNAGLIVLFFSLSGSKFVLAPALGVDFQLPSAAGAVVEARSPTSFISVTDFGQILAGDGLRTMEQLRSWLRDEARKASQPILLVRASRGVALALAMEIESMAVEAGFVGVMLAAFEVSPPDSGGRL